MSMATHQRLGHASPCAAVPADVLQRIVSLAGGLGGSGGGSGLRAVVETLDGVGVGSSRDMRVGWAAALVAALLAVCWALFGLG